VNGGFDPVVHRCRIPRTERDVSDRLRDHLHVGERDDDPVGAIPRDRRLPGARRGGSSNGPPTRKAAVRIANVRVQAPGLE